MKKCNPVDMRNALGVVDALKNSGVEFVAIPVLNDEHRAELFGKC